MKREKEKLSFSNPSVESLVRKLFFIFYFCCFLLAQRDEARRKSRGEAFNVISIASRFLTVVHPTRRGYSIRCLPANAYPIPSGTKHTCIAYRVPGG